MRGRRRGQGAPGLLLALLGPVTALGVPATPATTAPTSASRMPASLPATLTMGEGRTPISPTAVNGFNVGYDMSVAEAQAAVRSVAPTSLRYPPGNVGDEQDLSRAALTSFRSTLQLAAGGQAAGPGSRAPGGPPPPVPAPPIVATIETRVFATRPESRNRPEDAAQAARDAQALGLRVGYWEVGNEPDLYRINRGDSSWTPERYCQTFRAQRAAILEVDPQARFAGPAVSNVSGDSGAFLETFVRDCGDVVDLLSWHEYPSAGELSDEAALATAPRVSEHLARLRALLADPARNPRGQGRPVALGVTEYSLSYRSNRSRHLSDMVGALWAAETTLRLADGGAALAQYFALIGSGGHGLVDLAGVPRPTLSAFQQLTHYRGEARAIHSSDPALWVHAAQQGRALTLLVSNTATDPHPLAPALPGYTLTGAKTVTAQTVDDEAEPLRLQLAPRLSLPARSLTRLAYRAVSPP
jgi:hypothetical protein